MLAKGIGVFEASQMLHKASNPAKVLRAALTDRIKRVSKNR
jgi:hypothetical protein